MKNRIGDSQLAIEFWDRYKPLEIERTAFEQAEMILYAALDLTIAGKARKGDFVRCLDHFKLLQSPIN